MNLVRSKMDLPPRERPTSWFTCTSLFPFPSLPSSCRRGGGLAFGWKRELIGPLFRCSDPLSSPLRRLTFADNSRQVEPRLQVNLSRGVAFRWVVGRMDGFGEGRSWEGLAIETMTDYEHKNEHAHPRGGCQLVGTEDYRERGRGGEGPSKGRGRRTFSHRQLVRAQREHSKRG